MGGATNKLFSLLSSSTTSTAAVAAAAAPFPLLLHRRRRFCTSILLLRSRHKPFLLSRGPHFLTLSVSPSSPTPTPTPNAPRHFHSALHDHHFSSASPSPVLCPEWSDLLHALSAAGYFDRNSGFRLSDELSSSLHLPDDFARAASACLEFARDRAALVRLLSRRDVEVLIRNGTPFLFRDADDSAAKLRAFLFNGESNELDIDKVSTVDLMRFILSYASNLVFPSESNSLYNRELVESSVRNLLHELAKLCYVVPDPNSFGSMQNQLVDGNKEPVRPFGQKIEMKRGDWICARCSFMNFARNLKCLECEEARPKRQLTGGEWECPQCDFFNYARNTVCLRCDCKRPGEVSVSPSNTGFGGGYQNGSNSDKADIDSRLAANEEKAQRWFSKISQLDSTSDISSIADDDFPEIMPLRKGVNRFVVSTRKTPLERRMANSQYQTNLDGQRFGQSKGRNSNYVPYVPLPPDMFAKKPENSEAENGGKALAGRHESVASNSNTREWADSAAGSHKSEEIVKKQLNQAESNKEKEQNEKSERWFEKVAELHNVTDLASEISDEDFPEIMPMRKGENRFVVSKKKDRSLTSPAYKRQMAMEQASNTKFVPFVPFPPDYFAKKDKPQADGTELVNKDAAETTPSSKTTEKLPEGSDSARPRMLNENYVQRTEDRVSLDSWNSVPSGNNLSENETHATYAPPASGKFTQNCAKSYSSTDDNLGGGEAQNSTLDLAGSSLKQSENQNTREGWTGKSLEGSAVKEPDPLDMSEEAKAERWFRRVAQIKDISELSQIPDEDFPSIMPMRKGVNRFVVSKRKTPLERRLTSPQYRRNLPIVSSDPVKKDNDRS
ncbi:zinc finger protein VAR3, chloroplastic [Morus notabilis]|uniref:zinc finger protein VAR3, chloroplastic n=1 Tax=Morus notabilis TaxID=981085 RepID=UPI000CED1F1D|nr:zinc finger protein VAR3, chloroplastic [Morus notabilis]